MHFPARVKMEKVVWTHFLSLVCIIEQRGSKLYFIKPLPCKQGNLTQCCCLSNRLHSSPGFMPITPQLHVLYSSF